MVTNPIGVIANEWIATKIRLNVIRNLLARTYANGSNKAKASQWISGLRTMTCGTLRRVGQTLLIITPPWLLLNNSWGMVLLSVD